MTKNMLWRLGATVLVGNLALIELGACAHAHEGPMEKAGRKTDDAASDVKSGTKKAADDIKGD